MKSFFIQVTLTSLLIANLSGALAQNALVGTGFSDGWGGSCSSTGAVNFKYLSAGTGNTYQVSTVASGTGDRYFRFGVDWGGTTKQLTITSGSDEPVTPGTKYSLNTTCTTSGAMKYNAANTTDNYVFKTLNAGTNPTGTFVFFRIEGAVVTVSSVARVPAGAVSDDDDIVVNATLSGSLSTGQAVWIRYSQDDFTNSVVAKLTGSGTAYSSTIPASYTTTGQTVKYYLFTSGDVASITGADADLYTINLNNNGGVNYTTGAILPVEMTDFKAVRTNGQVALSWQTASEKDNSHFEVERSISGENWTQIGEVKGAGNSFTTREYSFADAQPNTGVNYYRLKQMDYNGTFEYSKVISVVVGDKGQRLRVYPNPVATTLTLDGAENAENIQIFDATGKIIRNASNANQLIINELPNGLYFLKAFDATGNAIGTTHFIKQ
jgi:hypothetical protein